MFLLTRRLTLVVTLFLFLCEKRVETRPLWCCREMMFMITREVRRSAGPRRWGVNYVILRNLERRGVVTGQPQQDVSKNSFVLVNTALGNDMNTYSHRSMPQGVGPHTVL